jgi:hypothetical protein
VPTSHDDDPLGMFQVSSWYWPGSWAAWFLTICGSWLHLWIDNNAGSMLDVNAWMYLAFAQWTAVDLI